MGYGMETSKNNTNKFIVQGSILAIASILVRVIGIIYRIPMVRIIGSDGYGLYGIAFNIYNVALILSSYSLPLAVSKLIAARNIKREYRNSYRILVAAILFAIASGITFSSILFFGAEFIASTLYNDLGVVYPLRILAPTIFVFAVMGVLRGFFQGKNTMLPTAVSQIIEQIVNAIVSIAAAYLFMRAHDASKNIAAYGAAGGTLGTLLGALAGLIFLVVIFVMYLPTFRQHVHRDRYTKREPYTEIYKLLAITIIPIILSQTVYQMNGFLDDIIFKQTLTAKGIAANISNSWLGSYSGKYKLLTNVPIAISSALASAMIPSIVASKTLGAMDEVKAKIQSAIKFNMIIAIPAAVGMSVLSGPIIQLLWPGSSLMENRLLLYGGIAIIFYALSTITNSVLQAVNLMRLPVINAAISLAVHLVLVFIILRITNLGVYALIIGNVTFPIGICILNWYQMKKHIGFHHEMIKTFFVPTFSSCVMGVIVYFIYRGTYMLLKSNIISVAISVAFGIVVYFVCMIYLRAIEVEEIYRIPKGRKIVKLLYRFHILR